MFLYGNYIKTHSHRAICETQIVYKAVAASLALKMLSKECVSIWQVMAMNLGNQSSCDPKATGRT